jgi:hypothetical protein
MRERPAEMHSAYFTACASFKGIAAHTNVLKLLIFFYCLILRSQDFTEWMLERDAKYPGQPGAGHRMAKVQDRYEI